MKSDTEPHLWPTWNLSSEEADRFYRGSGRVTIAVDENHALLSVVYHSRCETREALQSALAEMHTHFPHAVTLEGSMRGRYFCEDLPDAGWREVWELEPASERERDIAQKKHGAGVEEEITPPLWPHPRDVLKDELNEAASRPRNEALEKHGGAIEAEIFERLWGRDAGRAEPQHEESAPDMDLDR
jgi:hypothetical protein